MLMSTSFHTQFTAKQDSVYKSVEDVFPPSLVLVQVVGSDVAVKCLA